MRISKVKQVCMDSVCRTRKLCLHFKTSLQMRSQQVYLKKLSCRMLAVTLSPQVKAIFVNTKKITFATFSHHNEQESWISVCWTPILSLQSWRVVITNSRIQQNLLQSCCLGWLLVDIVVYHKSGIILLFNSFSFPLLALSHSLICTNQMG